MVACCERRAANFCNVCTVVPSVSESWSDELFLQKITMSAETIRKEWKMLTGHKLAVMHKYTFRLSASLGLPDWSMHPCRAFGFRGSSKPTPTEVEAILKARVPQSFPTRKGGQTEAQSAVSLRTFCGQHVASSRHARQPSPLRWQLAPNIEREWQHAGRVRAALEELQSHLTDFGTCYTSSHRMDGKERHRFHALSRSVSRHASCRHYRQTLRLIILTTTICWTKNSRHNEDVKMCVR